MEKLSEAIPGLRLLTPQERVILKRVAQDKSSKEIAEEMGIAPKTVDAHRHEHLQQARHPRQSRARPLRGPAPRRDLTPQPRPTGT